jgi:hypothetical protein
MTRRALGFALLQKKVALPTLLGIDPQIVYGLGLALAGPRVIGGKNGSRVEAAGVGGALASGKIIVGNAGGTGEAQTVSGDLTLTAAGVAAIASGVVSNADVAANASIAATKLSAAAQASLALADSAIQASTASYTNVLAVAASALQPATGASVTNNVYVIVSKDDKTNTITIAGGKVTGFVVTE